MTEVLVASMLLSIVMTAVYTLFYTVISTWRSEENGGGQQRNGRSLLTLFERDYANLHGGGASFFEGTSDEITFYAVVSPLDVEAGDTRRLMKVSYHFNHAKGVVTREEATVEGGLPATASAGDDLGHVKVSGKASFVVATGVADFSLRYLWIQRPDSAYWQSRPVPVVPVVFSKHRQGWGFPQAIEVNVSLAASEAKAPPLEVQAHLPTRTPTRQRDSRELARMNGEAP